MSSTSPTSPGSSLPGQAAAADTPDWPVQAALAVENLVGKVRQKTTVPAVTVARAIVFGLLAGIVGLAALVLLSILLVRFIDIWLPGNVWGAHLVTAALFFLPGLLLWRRRNPRPEAS